MTGDPIADVIVAIVEDAIAAGVHLLDPAARQQTIREAVERERARWAALDPRTASEAADDAARRHHVTPIASTDATRPTDPAPSGEDGA